jgi:hypothetical protein
MLLLVNMLVEIVFIFFETRFKSEFKTILIIFNFQVIFSKKVHLINYIDFFNFVRLQ